MINTVLQTLQARLQEDLKDTDEIYKELEDDNISYRRRLNLTTLMFRLYGKTDRLRYAIGLIKDIVEQEKLFNQATNQQYSRQKHIVYTQNKIDNEIAETIEKCNCEKNHDNTKHTEEDDKEFKKIQKVLEYLKPYLKQEQIYAIDHCQHWYLGDMGTKPLTLNECKLCLQSLFMVIYKTDYEKRNEMLPMIEKLGELIIRR